MPTTLSVDLRQRAASAVSAGATCRWRDDPAAQSLAALVEQAFADLRNKTAG